VFTVLLEDVIPGTLKGMTNDTAFNYYSILAMAERNWGLGIKGKRMLGQVLFGDLEIEDRRLG
jgi:hypothetical protein